MARKRETSLLLLPFLLLATSGPSPAQSTFPRSPDGHPDFQGIWTNATLTPLERPAALPGKSTLTDAEARAFELAAIARIDDDRRGRDQDQDRGCDSPSAPPDCGRQLARVSGAKRTSLIIDPPDGHIPPLRPDARSRIVPPVGFDSIKQRPLPERCLLGFGSAAGPPMMPGYYNNNYQIVQTPAYLMILVEMVHDARIIRIDSAHLPASVRQWLGDSIGHWEGDTLVVDTTNFTEQTPFHGSSPNLHVIERFSPAGPKGFLYKATIDDPSTFASPWTLEYPFLATPGPIYEYSCHEGNYYPIVDILGGAKR